MQIYPSLSVQNTALITNFKSTGFGGILDLYTPILGREAVVSSSVPRWLPRDSWRRIKAYEALENLYLNSDTPVDSQLDMEPVRLGTVEYIIKSLRDLTIGAEQRICVAGAEAEGGDQALVKQQDALAEWAVRNKTFPKIQELERQAALLGDAFVRIRRGVTRGTEDVKLDVIHPSFVFPWYSTNDELESMALIWEEARILDDIEVLCVYKDEYYIGEDGNVRETAGWYNYTAVPSMSDLRLDEYDTSPSGDPINDIDLGIKQIPVYHLHNFWTADNFGESDIAYITHIFREMNATDTDLSAAASLLGVPPLVVAGMKGRIQAGKLEDTDTETVGPGKIITVDTNGGKAEYMNNSALLECLVKYYDRLEATLFRNTRLGKLFSGQTGNMRDIESSKALKTIMASLYARINQKRTIRTAFYAELLRGVRELFLQIDKTGNYPEEKMTLALGNILPSDNSDDLNTLSALWAQGKGPISAETAVRLAQKAGSGVVDLNREAAEVLKQVTPPKPSFGLAKPPAQGDKPAPGVKAAPGAKAPPSK